MLIVRTRKQVAERKMPASTSPQQQRPAISGPLCASAQTLCHGRERLVRRWHLSESEESVAMPESTESFIEAERAGYTWERRSPVPADDHVLGHTSNWLNALPKGARPVHLQKDFPRIANELARLWPEASELDRYFEDKEFSPRDDRLGFAPLIREELLAMHVYSLRTRTVAYEEQALQRAVHRAAILG